MAMLVLIVCGLYTRSIPRMVTHCMSFRKLMSTGDAHRALKRMPATRSPERSLMIALAKMHPKGGIGMYCVATNMRNVAMRHWDNVADIMGRKGLRMLLHSSR